MPELPLSKLSSILNNDETLRGLLLAGTTPEFLKSYLMTSRSLDSDRASVARMNLIGSLRNAGFKVTGGRAGGLVYQIIGFEQPSVESVEWSSSQQVILDWFDNLRPVESTSFTEVTSTLALRTSQDFRHENTWLYLWGYELVGNSSNRSQGRFFEGRDGGKCIIKRKFKDRPQFSIIDLNATSLELTALVDTLSGVSFAPVKIINPRYDTMVDVSVALSARTEKIEQPIYSVEKIAQDPQQYFSKQSWKTAKKMLREVERIYRTGQPCSPELELNAIHKLIDQWRVVRSESQARPATLRDYVISSTSYPRRITVFGTRDQSPVMYRAVERLSNNHTIAADLVEKSMNTSAFAGGHSGMSDACLITICEILNRLGVQWLNGGESSSVGPKLTGYKHKFQVSQTFSITLIPSVPYFGAKK